MRIAFIGDSFCSGISDHSWTNIVSRRLGAEVICRGSGGASVMQAYVDLENNIGQADAVVCCWTDHSRLYNYQGYPLNSASCMDFRRRGLGRMVTHDTATWSDGKLWNAGAEYYTYLYDDRYHRLTHRLIVSDADRMLSEWRSAGAGRVAVHFHSFPPAGGVWAFNSGPCCREALSDMVARHGCALVAGDTKDNHMDVDLNARFSNMVVGLLLAQTAGIFDAF
jgi:hypothetical protein